jgi:hypothetical protein
MYGKDTCRTLKMEGNLTQKWVNFLSSFAAPIAETGNDTNCNLNFSYKLHRISSPGNSSTQSAVDSVQQHLMTSSRIHGVAKRDPSAAVSVTTRRSDVTKGTIF